MRHGAALVFSCRDHILYRVSMATLTVSAPVSETTPRARTVASQRLPRWFCVGMAAAAFGVLIVGFAPSVYDRLPQTMPAMRAIVAAHAVLFSSWMVLFIVQTSLVATHHVRMHRWLGIAGVVLATVMVVTAPPMAVGLARRGQPSGTDPLVFMLVIVVDVVLFAAFFWSAVYFRRRAETHRRLMLLAMTALLAPAISRWPWIVRHPALGVTGMLLLFVIAPVVGDLLARRRPHAISVWGGLVVIVSGPLRFVVGQTAAWHALAQWIVG